MENVFFEWESDETGPGYLGPNFRPDLGKKKRKIDQLWAGIIGKSKMGMDMKLGWFIALRIAHNIPKNQPDRIKTVAYRILGRHT